MYNVKTKIYPDGSTNTTYCSYPKFKDPEIMAMYKEIQKLADDKETEDKETETPKKKQDRKIITCGIGDNSTDVREDNIKRAKDKIQDIALCNEFQYFATMTFDPKKVDSYNVDAVIKAIKHWFNDGVKRRNYKYIAIPEYHKSGRIHIHALISGDLKLKDSGHVRSGKKVYDITDWVKRFGWADVVEIDGNYTRLTYYITKYITKGNDKIFGRFYWSSKNLVRIPKTEFDLVDFDTVQRPEYEVKGTGIKYKYEPDFKFGSEDHVNA